MEMTMFKGGDLKMKNIRITFLSEGTEMNTIFDVAGFFLSKEDSSITNKKLQKLCYYAHAWSLALRNRKLFNERFQAWVHGPVSRELYQEYKQYGWNPIPYQEVPNNFSKDELKVLEEVYIAYGSFSGDDLESLTHSEKPWIKARGNCAQYEPSQEFLDDDLIKNYYFGIYEQSQND